MNVLTASAILNVLSVLIYICMYRYKENEVNNQPSWPSWSMKDLLPGIKNTEKKNI